MQQEIAPEVPDPSADGAHRLRRRLKIAALVLLWVALVCADAAHGLGPWLWAALAASWAALAMAALESALTLYAGGNSALTRRSVGEPDEGRIPDAARRTTVARARSAGCRCVRSRQSGRR